MGTSFRSEPDVATGRRSWRGAGGRHLLLTAALIAAAPADGQAPDSTLPLAELEHAIHIAISNARKLAPTPPHFLVTSVELQLQGTQATEVSGGFTLEVFGYGVDLGAKREDLTRDRLKISLAPERALVVGGSPKVDLAGLISNLRETFKARKAASSFLLTEVQYERVWALQYDVGGGVKFVIATTNTSISEDREQKLIFTLCETRDLRTCAKPQP